MKKFRLLSLLMALLLALNCAVGAVRAEPEETTLPTETTVPIETLPPMPADFAGDASVEYGCRTLDAQRPLASLNDYTAQAKGALVYDLTSDTLVFAQDADLQLYPASLTKVMTCLLTLEMEPNLDTVVTVTSAGLKGMEPGGSNASLKVDEKISVRNLLYCLMVKSANDAASVLAVHISGSIEGFVEVMNARAAEIGCTGTNFVNPHGLHHEDHCTTARDMAKILREAMKYPLFEEIFSTKEYIVPATNLTEERKLTTTNFMIRSSGYPIVLDSRVIGGKTGYTSKAGRCFVALAEKNGMRLLTVVLGTKPIYQADGYSFIRYGNFEETSGLLNFTYKNYTSMQVLNTTQVAGQFAVAGGEHNAFGALTEDMFSTVPKGSDSTTIRYEYTLLPGGLEAPVTKGQEIGLVRVWYGNICLAQQTLQSSTDVAVEKFVPADTDQEDPGEDTADWDGILKIVLIVVAAVFVTVVFMNMRAAAIRRRRRRRKKAAAKAAKSGRRV